MPANVESMFYVREVPWHGLGQRVEEALTSEQALEMSGLNWDVVQKDLFTYDADPMKMLVDNRIEGYKANIRSTDGQVLGIVTDKYQVVQNKEAFAFTDLLLNNSESDVKYETAGSLANGKRIWLLASMPSEFILGDKVTPYLVFTTGHDGKHIIRVAITPIRVVCQNTLNLALKDSQRFWSSTHTGDMTGKLQDAKETLGLAQKYMKDLAGEAEYLADCTLDTSRVKYIIEQLFPMPNKANASLSTIANVEQQRATFEKCYITQDIQKFVGTKWGIIQAVSDYATHSEPARRTKNFDEMRFIRTIDGNPLIDKTYELINKL